MKNTYKYSSEFTQDKKNRLISKYKFNNIGPSRPSNRRLTMKKIIKLPSISSMKSYKSIKGKGSKYWISFKILRGNNLNYKVMRFESLLFAKFLCLRMSNMI